MIVWLNGELIRADTARIDPADRGFTLGDGLFETIAVRGGKILRLEAHRARLKRGCEVLGLSYPSADLAAAIRKVVSANRFTDAVLRLTLTRGPAMRGLLPSESPRPTLLINAVPMPEAPPPARCVIATVTRRNEYSPLARVKSLNYLDNILARREAAARGADEAILLNTMGRVTESCVANLFIVKGARVQTPPVKDGALAGVMRAAVLNACVCAETPLTPEDLTAADGIFLTSSLGIRPVASIDGEPAGEAARAFMEDLRVRLDADQPG